MFQGSSGNLVLATPTRMAEINAMRSRGRMKFSLAIRDPNVGGIIGGIVRGLVNFTAIE
jgi:hypothetical protein